MSKSNFSSIAAALLFIATPALAQNGANAPNEKAAMASGQFANVPARAEFGSKAIGLDVYNAKNQDIGTIKDVAIENNDVTAYIVGVGGFLGAGERYVAVRPSAINLSYDAANKKWQAKTDITKNELKAAPQFQYPSSM